MAHRLKHAAHSATFACFDNGVIRQTDPAEDDHYEAEGWPLVTTGDEAAYNRAVCAAYALMGITPPAHNAGGV